MQLNTTTIIVNKEVATRTSSVSFKEDSKDKIWVDLRIFSKIFFQEDSKDNQQGISNMTVLQSQ